MVDFTKLVNGETDSEEKGQAYKVFDARLNFSVPGTFVGADNKEHETKLGISIKTIDSPKAVKISGKALTAIYCLIRDNQEVRDLIQIRSDAEKNTELHF